MGGTTTKREAARALTKHFDIRLAGDLERLLVAGYDAEAMKFLTGAAPRLPDGFDLTDNEWREAVLDALDPLLVETEDGEDIDDVQTTMMPNYANFARDLREDVEDEP